DVSDPRTRGIISGSMIALVSDDMIGATGGDLSRASSWGDLQELCPGEPFADQPAAAFCSGVLVDWDLVLTAGHCARAFAVDKFRAVFDYSHAEPGHLAGGKEAPGGFAAIVSEAPDPAGSEPRLDFAWLRLEKPMTPPRQPVSL